MYPVAANRFKKYSRASRLTWLTYARDYRPLCSLIDTFCNGVCVWNRINPARRRLPLRHYEQLMSRSKSLQK